MRTGLSHPAKAFCPHGQLTGLQIGAKAETLWYIPGFLRKQMSAPWPPMLHKRCKVFVFINFFLKNGQYMHEQNIIWLRQMIETIRSESLHHSVYEARAIQVYVIKVRNHSYEITPSRRLFWVQHTRIGYTMVATHTRTWFKESKPPKEMMKK